MYEHVLIATDGSEVAQKAVDQGLALAKALNAKVTVITVTEPWFAVAPPYGPGDFPIEQYDKIAAEGAALILRDVEAAARRAGVACETLHVKDKFAAAGIIETARDHGCDIIVMSSHGRRGLTRLLLGSQANKVVTSSTVPVLICR